MMEPQETAELIHRLGRTSSNPAVHSNTYTVSIIRAEDLFSKSKSGKPACGFVSVYEGEERLIKTKTVLDQSAPRWEQGFETSGPGVKTLELSAMDRQPIGKHDVIGKAVSLLINSKSCSRNFELIDFLPPFLFSSFLQTFVLNPRSFAEVRSQDLWLPLNPRGRVLVRIGMVGDLHDVAFYFMRAARRLVNAERGEHRSFLSDQNSTIQLILSFYRRYVSQDGGEGSSFSLQFPSCLVSLTLPPSVSLSAPHLRSHRSMPPSCQGARQKSCQEQEARWSSTSRHRHRDRVSRCLFGFVSRENVRADWSAFSSYRRALVPLTIYLDANFLTFTNNFTDNIKNGVIVALWRGLVSCLLDVLCPPLAVQSSTVDPLTPEDTEIVFKWLKVSSFISHYLLGNFELTRNSLFSSPSLFDSSLTRQRTGSSSSSLLMHLQNSY